jgi:peroxiredoxin
VQLRQKYEELLTLNTQVIAVAPDTVEVLAPLARVLKLPYPLLADPLRTAFESYGLLLREELLGGDFVLDASGVIRYIHRGTRAEDRPSWAELRQAVQAAPQAKQN